MTSSLTHIHTPPHPALGTLLSSRSPGLPSSRPRLPAASTTLFSTQAERQAGTTTTRAQSQASTALEWMQCQTVNVVSSVIYPRMANGPRLARAPLPLPGGVRTEPAKNKSLPLVLWRYFSPHFTDLQHVPGGTTGFSGRGTEFPSFDGLSTGF